jgi:hypothetical protein
MNPQSEPTNGRVMWKFNPEYGSGLVLEIVCGHVPSFKNHKHSSRSGFVYTDPKIKRRMAILENSILCGLYSSSQTNGSETPSECWKRLRTLLSGLCDDSIREIPCGSWGVEYVSKGSEGVRITIERINDGP